MTITNPEARRRAADEAFARASGRLAGEAELMLLLAKIPATVPADELAESFDRALVGEARPAVLIEPPPPPARLPRLRAPRALRPLVRRVPLAWRLAVRGGLRRVIGFRPALRRRPQPAAAPPPTPPADDLLPATHGTPPSEWCAATGPRVTIVIVNWDAADLTRWCVETVWARTDGVSYDIVIVDNGSQPDDLARLPKASGIHVIRLGVNRFYGEANNIGVEAAAAPYVCLLNNDAFVTPGWLAALLAPLEADPTIGATGPKFLFPDGRLQEAGAMIGLDGIPQRLGRGGDASDPRHAWARDVDYVSGAALLLRREDFLACGGFDLTYEPAYYEDVDLCLKLRLLGRSVRYCPDAEVVHIEGASSTEPEAVARRRALGDLNREKFLARWSDWLTDASKATADDVRRRVLPHRADPALRPALPCADIQTPYMLTPGGGERTILTMAAVLSRTHDVRVVTTHRYSRARLLNLGHEFDIDLTRCGIVTEAMALSGRKPDLLVTLGNHLLPAIPARGRRNAYLCQYPFRMVDDMTEAWRDNIAGYERVLTYSSYVEADVRRGFGEVGVTPPLIEVLHPPVQLCPGDARAKRRMVLTVGRFIAGGHTKRHDSMIDAFRVLAARIGPDVELHIAGSSFPTPHDLAYLSMLQEAAADLPIRFHVNATKETLRGLFADAMVYWHATGYGIDVAEEPERTEHFGISVVEAMSAACVPVVFAAGGPLELIQNGETGYLFADLDEMVDRTEALLASPVDRERLARAAQRDAAQFDVAIFAERVRLLASSVAPQRRQPAGLDQAAHS